MSSGGLGKKRMHFRDERMNINRSLSATPSLPSETNCTSMGGIYPISNIISLIPNPAQLFIPRPRIKMHLPQVQLILLRACPRHTQPRPPHTPAHHSRRFLAFPLALLRSLILPRNRQMVHIRQPLIAVRAPAARRVCRARRRGARLARDKYVVGIDVRNAFTRHSFRRDAAR